MLKNLPNYFIFSNLTKRYFKKQTYACSSGTYCQLLEIKHELNICVLKLPSGKKITFKSDSQILTGRNNNLNKKYEIQGKASYNKKLGLNPKVRGVAKNPVDHPHGGRTKTVQPEVSP